MGSLNYNNAYYWLHLMCKKNHALNDHFPDPLVFNKAKIFNLRNYPSDDSDRNTNTDLGLKRTLLRFQFTKEESDMCKRELLEFMLTLQHECENKTVFEA